jgi:hypothetical protein
VTASWGWLLIMLWVVGAYGVVWLVRRPAPEDSNSATVALPQVQPAVCAACAAGSPGPHGGRCGQICLCRVSAPGFSGSVTVCRRCGGGCWSPTGP